MDKSKADKQASKNLIQADFALKQFLLANTKRDGFLVEEEHLLCLHAILMKDVITEISVDCTPGRYRQADNSFSEVIDNKPITYQPPRFYDVANLMEAYIETMRNSWTKENTFNLVAQSIGQLFAIHPFYDGNRRVALSAGKVTLVLRLQRDMSMIQAIKLADRTTIILAEKYAPKYLLALIETTKKNFTPLCQLLEQCYTTASK